jgi:hypothetical protein
LRNLRYGGLILVVAGVSTLLWGLLAEGDDTTALPWAAAYVAMGIVVMLAVRYLGYRPSGDVSTATRVVAAGGAVAAAGAVTAMVGGASGSSEFVTYGLGAMTAGVAVGLVGLFRRRASG